MAVREASWIAAVGLLVQLMLPSPVFAQAACDTTRKCAQQAVEAAAAAAGAAKAMESRLAGLESTLAGFGGGRILGIAQVKGNSLIYGSPGVSYDTGKNEISFGNKDKLHFVPIITNTTAATYITGHYWVNAVGNNSFQVRQHAADTAGAERTSAATDFSALIVGYE